MRRDEVHRDLVFGAMFDKGVYPCSLCAGWSSHTKPLVYALNCSRRVIVKLPVGCLLGLAAPKIQIRFVPNFEVPLCNFIDAITVDQMFRKRGDEVVPLVPILGRRNIRPVPE